jgi:hypothetical protein
MKKVSILCIIILGILAIIVLEGRALHHLQKEHAGNYPEMLPMYLLCVGQELVTPAENKPFHHSEI